VDAVWFKTINKQGVVWNAISCGADISQPLAHSCRAIAYGNPRVISDACRATFVGALDCKQQRDGNETESKVEYSKFYFGMHTIEVLENESEYSICDSPAHSWGD
jgi:hypothetical protein